MSQTIITHLASSAFQFILVVIFIAGMVRGFSGFGTGMIVAPAAASIYSPQMALVMIFIIDSLPAIPVVLPEVKRANWRELWPILAGTALFLPLGLYVLKFGDPVMLRWFITLIILLAVAALSTGWIYKGPRSNLISFIIGTFCGFFAGTAALPGPPAIIYWMASELKAIIIRANTMVFLFIVDLMSGFGLFIGGMFTLEGMIKGAIAAPFYLLGLLGGKKCFGLASEKTYKRIAFTIICLSAIISLPLLDHLLRG